VSENREELYGRALIGVKILTVREKQRPEYRVIEFTGDYGALYSALPGLKTPHNAHFPYWGWLILDPEENVVIGWTSTLDNYEIMEEE